MTGKREVRYVPDSFQLVAGGVKQPRHPGYTETEWREQDRRHREQHQSLLIGLLVLAAIAISIKSCVG